MKRKNITFYILIVPVLMWLILLIVLPHVDLLISSFQYENDFGEKVFSFNNYLSFFKDPVYWLTFVRTAFYSIAITILAFVITFPVAFYLTKVVAKKYSSFMTLLLLIPIWVGELVTIYGWMVLLSDNGVINNFLINLGIIDKPIVMLYTDFSMIIGLLYMSMLFMIVPMMSALESLDDSLIEAASDLGASKWTIITRIVIPYAMPGIASGSIMVFMLIIGDYVAPNILGGKSSLWFTEQIYNFFLTTIDWSQGSAFGFLLLILSSAIIWGVLKITGQKLERVGS
ncbi:ABC transporter permease [Sulfurospirillum sp. 1307]|jgi:spermidine/putrescine transport system permease protein